MARFGASAVLVGLAAALGLSGAAGATEWTLTTLYRFGGGTDGESPGVGPIADGNGALYGTTFGNASNYRGTIYQLAPPASAGGAWTEHVLLNFAGGHLGEYPEGGLVLMGGSLYGLTPGDGTAEDGMAYRLYPPAATHSDWRESVLYPFTEGDHPSSTLLHGKGNVLYGTGDDTNTYGSVFSFTPPAIAGGAWTESYLHLFSETGAEGYEPGWGVIADSAGALYGTTSSGSSAGYGAVYKLTPPTTADGTWTVSVLHAFQGGTSDGATPQGGLVMDSNGVLYGTTHSGGSNDFGTAFRLAPPAKSGGAWDYSVLYTFKGYTFGNTIYHDGAYPSGLILGATGDLYGVTNAGGEVVQEMGFEGGNGTVFRLAPPATSGGAWTETVLYRFTAGTDGFAPLGRLLLLHGALYGVTEQGGTAAKVGTPNGYGTVFKLTAP